ncbi:hypothetical protein, partial [Pseudomonas cannabina]|uniref:hypothetical protein n=1 Tax=Pseudomonas cannabina TaxID=86840 RepID=UPI0011C3D2BD
MESNARRINAVMPLVNLDGRTYTGCVDKDLWALVNPPSVYYRDRGGYESKRVMRPGPKLEKVKAMLISGFSGLDQHGFN